MLPQPRTQRRRRLEGDAETGAHVVRVEDELERGARDEVLAGGVSGCGRSQMIARTSGSVAVTTADRILVAVRSPSISCAGVTSAPSVNGSPGG